MLNEIDHRSTRREFLHGELHRADLLPEPHAMLAHWLKDAEAAGNFDVTAMALATASLTGRPSVRWVLLKHFDARGLCFYTDGRSRKGRELADNPQASLAFYWPENDRQVRIEGRVERLPDADNEAYFKQRLLGSRFAAAASHQSQPLASREVLEARIVELKQQYPEGDVPRNPDWGGFRLLPEVYEFWQGRASRLHDRFTYTRTAAGWEIQRLMP
ncbi:MAG: pyridoxamine 5'-phosphate oxidase [Gammaproteobacteria bacterium 28-57-27]|nr:MAG: pyridoxamine 5'-phosphate oxidase [Gammaproteobacteria bacterium 28-57-27]